MHLLGRLVAGTTALLAAASLSACTGTGGQSEADAASGAGAGDVHVTASFYPLAYVAEQVGGDRVTVTDLTPQGGHAHELELSPHEATDLSHADLVVHLGGGFQPAVDAAVQSAGVPALDGMAAIPDAQLREGDPHVWLNPLILAEISDQTATKLAEVDPEGAETYQQNAKELRAQLEELNAEYTDALAGCEGETVVTSHEAFGYLADAYGLRQEGVTGINPEAEPSPKRIREIKDVLQEAGAKTVFLESGDATQQQLGDTLGVEVGELNTLETGAPEGQDYLDVMRSNLANLQSGLDC